jgi:hypothetical protein
VAHPDPAGADETDTDAHEGILPIEGDGRRTDGQRGTDYPVPTKLAGMEGLATVDRVSIPEDAIGHFVRWGGVVESVMFRRADRERPPVNRRPAYPARRVARTLGDLSCGS